MKAINPQIQEKLEQFANRRRRLIVIRGICAGVLSLLGVMILVALLDRIFMLGDAALWMLSLFGYSSAIGAVWITCLRLLKRVPTSRELARLIELGQPELREDLISAVELGAAESGSLWDSEIFRKLVQNDVAKRLGTVNIESILPLRLIRTWIQALAGVLVFTLLLIAVPHLYFGQLMLRALLPMANLERISSVKVQIKKPSPANHVVPKGEDVAVVVGISGPEPDKILLETFRGSEPPQRVLMKPFGPREYISEVPIERESVRYRIRAGDAITRKYTLEARSRPHVKKFEKTYRYPSYSKLPDQRAVEENGNMAALEGSEVLLVLEADQPLLEGSLRIKQNGQEVSLPLTPAEGEPSTGNPRRMQAKLPIQNSGSYEVHLVAAETSFENKFSPQYEIKALADLLPRVQFDKPKEDLNLQPDELVQVQGNATDDLGVASISQMIRINEGEVIEVPLEKTSGKTVSVSRNWDLSELQLHAGDRIVISLVATDLKGNRAESSPIHILLNSSDSDPDQLKALEAKRMLGGALKNLQNTAQELERHLAQAEAKGKQTPSDELQNKQLAVGAGDLAEELSRQTQKANEELKEAIRTAQTEREASDLALVGRMLSQVQHTGADVVQSELQRLSGEKNPQAGTERLKRAGEASRQALSKAKTMTETFKDLLASEEAASLSQDVARVANEQDQIVRQAAAEAATYPKAWERMARREGAVVNETKAMEEILKDFAQQASGPAAASTRKLQQAIQTGRTALEQTLTKKAMDSTLAAPSANLQKALEAARKEVFGIQQDFAKRADQARKLLAKEAGSASAEMANLRKEIETHAAALKKTTAGQPESRSAEKLDDAWKSVMGSLQDRAAQEELRHNADSAFAGDTARVAQALNALQAASNAPEQTEKVLESIKTLEKAYQTLEEGRQLGELSTGLQQLREKERWEPASSPSASLRGKDWNWLEQQMDTAQSKAKSGSNMPPPALNKLSDAVASPESKRIRKEMSERNVARKSVPVTQDVEKLNAVVEETRNKFQPALEEARAAIVKATPTLSEQIAGVAQSVNALQKSTLATAEEAIQTPSDNKDPHHIGKLLEEQQKVGRQLDGIRDQIRRDANEQNVLTEEGRERARDGDDSVAILKTPPGKAEDLISEALKKDEVYHQKLDLNAAAKQQAKLSDSLQLIAKHYDNLAKNRPEETRKLLRKAEEELGMKKQMDELYARAEEMEKMSSMATRSTAEELIAELEQELARNKLMQKELAAIAQKEIEDSKDTLIQTAKEAADSAAEFQKMAQENNAGKMAIDQQSQKLAQEMSRFARQELSSIKTPVNGMSELANAQRTMQFALENMPKATPASPKAMAQELANMIQPLQQAEAELRDAAAKTSPSSSSLPSPSSSSNTNGTPSQGKSPSQGAAKANGISPSPSGTSSGKSNTAGGSPAAGTPSQNFSQAADQLGQFEQKAKQIMDDLQKIAEAESQIAQTAEKQSKLSNAVQGAGADLGRAGRHEGRLGKTNRGGALEEIEKKLREAANRDIAPPPAKKGLANVQSASEAQSSMQKASATLQNQLKQLDAALNKPAEPSTALHGTPSQASPEESLWAARTLDRLDAELHSESQGSGGGDDSSGGGGGGGDAQQAMAAAAQAQGNAMKAARNNSGGGGGGGGDSGGGGAGSGGTLEAVSAEDLAASTQKNGDWGKLPPKIARDLIEAQRENVPAEYRGMVDTYFKVIAEKAKENSP